MGWEIPAWAHLSLNKSLHLYPKPKCIIKWKECSFEQIENYFYHKFLHQQKDMFLYIFSVNHTTTLPLQVFDRIDLTLNDTYERLEAILNKMKWTNFPGVQSLIMKGLTLESTSEPSRELLSRYTVL